tara:strand:- start:867 stop:1559 length:693 start_codon:yes stop_codon:yes gene_type:complete
MTTKITKEILSPMMKYAFNEGKIPEKDKHFTKAILTAGSESGSYKEELVLHKLSYDLDASMHDYDGYTNGRPVEVKSESFKINKKGVPQYCRGAVAFGAPANPKQKANKFSKDDMLLVVSSWTSNGKCISIVEFDWKESNLPSKMKTFKPKGTSSAFKGTVTDFKDCKSLTVKYANPKYFKYLNPVMQEIVKPSIMTEIDVLSKEEMMAEVCKGKGEKLKQMYFECLISS